MKKIGIIITMILIVCVGIFTINVFNSKDKKIINDDLGNTLAIMISNENGIGYKDYEKVTWPSKEYKFKEAKCFDINGGPVENVVTFNEETRKAKITTNQTVSCTLYFDKPIISYLRDNDRNNNLSSTIQGDMYRYQGTNELVNNNYICFGTTDKDECVNDEDKYMYRILGINDLDELKLIKMNPIKEKNVSQFSWNETYGINSKTDIDCNNEECPDWPDSLLFKRLNGISNGVIKGSGNNENKADTDIFVDSEEYDYLKSPSSTYNTNGSSCDNNECYWYNIIKEHEWLYGDICNYSIAQDYDGLKMYLIESGNENSKRCYLIDSSQIGSEDYKWSPTVTAKIGLMYIYDFFLSYYDGVNEDTRGHASTDFNLLQGWISPGISTQEWPMTRHGFFTGIGYDYIYVRAWRFRYNYEQLYADANNLPLNDVCMVRPVFYLVNTIQLSGKGTIDNPYIIN